jgi:ferredoxin
MRRTLLLLLAAIVLAGTPRRGAGQDFVTTALTGLPAETSHLEYSSPSRLRATPGYQSLKGKFAGASLQQLGSTLDQLGISEYEVDGLMVGWKPGDKETDLYGYASGHFDRTEIAKRAAAQNLVPTPISGHPAYCFSAGARGTCVVILEDSLGAFGPPSSLTQLLEAHAEQPLNLIADPRFAGLLENANKAAPIWGIALGGAAADYLSAWLSTQNNLKLDWGKVFEKVDSLTYSIDPADKLEMDLKLQCVSQQDAATLRQILDGVRMAQQLAWQFQNPGRPNPYAAVNVDQHDTRIDLNLKMDYSALALVNGVTAPQQ